MEAPLEPFPPICGDITALIDELHRIYPYKGTLFVPPPSPRIFKRDEFVSTRVLEVMEESLFGQFIFFLPTAGEHQRESHA